MDPQSARREPGRLVATYGPGRTALFLGWLLAGLFLGVGGFLLWIRGQVGRGIEFHGDPAVLVGTAVGALLLGAIVGALTWRIVGSHVRIEEYEQGLRTLGRGIDDFAYFADIEDVWIAPNTLWGWRVAPGGRWTVVDQRLSRGGRLLKRLVEQQAAQRGPGLLARLRAGDGVGFRIACERPPRNRVGSDPVHPAADIVLSVRELVVDGLRLPIERIAGMELRHTDTDVRFVAPDGAVLAKLSMEAVLSRDLLAWLIRQTKVPAAA